MRDILKFSTKVFLCVIALFVLSIVKKSDFASVFATLNTSVSSTSAQAIDISNLNKQINLNENKTFINRTYTVSNKTFKINRLKAYDLVEDLNNSNSSVKYKYLALKKCKIYETCLIKRKYEQTIGPPKIYKKLEKITEDSTTSVIFFVYYCLNLLNMLI